MSSALERARALLAANATNAAAPPAAQTSGTPTTPPRPGGAGTAAAAAPAQFVFESPKLKLAIDALEKRCDEIAATLDHAIGEMEASALDQRLRGWFDAIGQRRNSGRVVIATAGIKMPDRVAASCGLETSLLDGVVLAQIGDEPGVAAALGGIAAYSPRTVLPERTVLVALTHLDALVTDPFLLGALRRECVGLLWLAPPNALPSELAQTFAESPLGVVSVLPSEPELAPQLRRAVCEDALPALATLGIARAFVELAAAVSAEHGRENARLAMQTFLAERAKGARSLSADIATRKEVVAQVRDDVARDLQAIVDELSRAIALIDGDLLLRLPMRQALDAIPALRAQEKLVYAHEFEIEERHQWWQGTGWERMSFMFPRKLRLTIPTVALRSLSHDLTSLLASLISKNALRRIDAFGNAIEDFGAASLGVGVNLQAAGVTPAERARFERKLDSLTYRRMQSTISGPTSTLEERIARPIDATCEKDLKNLHVDIDRKGPIGKIMEARTAVMGVSFLIMTTIRVSGAWGNVVHWLATRGATSAQAAAQNAIPWNIFLNASLIGFFIILLGLIVSRITEDGKEGAIVSEKVADAREALEDKLMQVMQRVVDGELGAVKTLLVEHRAAALERLDHTLEAKKLELDEVDRKSRTAAARPGTKNALSPLPTSLRGDLDKTGLAMRDLRAEYALRTTAFAEATAAARAIAARPATAPQTAAAPTATVAPATPDVVPPDPAASATNGAATARPVDPALAALAQRAAHRAEENGAMDRPANPALAALAARAAQRAAEKAAAAATDQPA